METRKLEKPARRVYFGKIGVEVKRRVVIALVAAGAFAAVLSISVAITAAVLNTPPRGVDDVRSFSVESGEGLSSIAERLKKEGLIRSTAFFKIAAALSGAQYAVQKGDYLFEGRPSACEILSILTSGKQALTDVVIPEGFTVRQTAETLFENGIIDDQQSFLDAVARFPLDDYGVEKTGAEGFLFPDTYAFQKRMENEEVISAMTDNFFSKVNKAGLPIGERFYEGVVLASIIEKEYQAEEEAPLIASVFVNRLKKNMRLESCATVLYILTDIQGKPHPNRLFYTDLEIESPFNTYRNFGLPPAPISNPGMVALTAAFHPAQSEYLFFVVKNDGSGRHTFSKDFYTHNYYKRHN